MPTPIECQRTRGRGFTLLELLLVVGVISILIALLLPAIQSSRELARRTQCAKNLMMIGIAVGNYQASNRVFPPGVVNETGPITFIPKGYHWGWQARLLPYLESGNLYNQLNFMQGVYEAANDTSRVRNLQAVLCPSDGSSPLNNYAGCHHDVEAPIAADNHGVLFLNSRINHDDIKDGLAFTILAGEFMGSTSSQGWAIGTRSSLRNTGGPVNAPSIISFSTQTRPFVGRTSAAEPQALEELERQIEDDQLDASLVGGFSSHHSGGSNFLLCDGSIRFLTERLSPSVFQSLGHRADGNLISSDDY